MLLTAHALALPGPAARWTELTVGKVRVECTTDAGRPYCRSTGVISVPLASAVATFARLDEHQDKMQKISKIERLQPDVLHVVMDYPFPVSDRDYVARFSLRTEADGTVVYGWTPVTDPRAPDDGSTVRLTWLDGEWRFAAEGAHTRVTYVWEADPGGSLPDVGMVRKQAGLFAVQDIANACGATIVSH